ncbi:Aminopeptidase [Nesidiocoris tenuis]|uniref:Aminopeptidase n=1 Tax=Nesidiocoris tenuis TaxID=355587 RepID=A0ABN7BIK8_9HEMI|nr:Aminopeptidase [Nesidiocoris tenuis]
MQSTEFQRLPGNVKPVRYQIYLKPDLVNSTFNGHVDVQISIHIPTHSIQLNSLDLEITNPRLTLSDGTVLIPSETNISKEAETLTLVFGSEIPSAEGANLHLEFSGLLNDSLKGLYRSNTSKAGDPVKYAAVCQFAPTDARRCFPCWDEPAIKSVFEVTLVAPKDAVALSNMPCVSETIDGELKTCKFAPSPIMSTYLVAVIVGDFDYIEDTSEDGVLVRVYTPPGASEQGRYALHVATKALPYYKDYFQMAYPLPKLDVIAIPDLSYGAMENWGLITFRQACLLIDPINSSSTVRQGVAKIIGHEIAHQWFGNIVTMEWWTHLWLNEGFANFIENLCVAQLFPSYNIWSQFLNTVLNQALKLDSLESSHPIEVPVKSPGEINEIFDAISYCKGASIIRMLHHFIGDDNFRKGMNLYLTRHEYKNTCTEDLWDALEEVSSTPVRDTMSTWTRQKGFPLVTVQSAKFENGNLVLTLSQEKFVAGSTTTNCNDLWLIPLNIGTQGGTKHSCMVTKKTEIITVPNVPENSWVKLNYGTTGCFRVKYTDDLFERLIPAILDGSLPPLDRMGLLLDCMALVKAGHKSSSEMLKLLSLMINEEDPVVWGVIASCMDQLDVIVANTTCADKFKTFGCHVFKRISKKISWDASASESHMEKILRTLVLTKLATYGDQETLDNAMNRFNAHLAGAEEIPADLRTPVYRSVAYVGGESSYQALLKLHREATLQEEKDRILSEMGSFSCPELLSKILDFFFLTNDVRIQEKVSIILSVGRSKVGMGLVWEFIKSNWDRLYKLLQGGLLISRLIKMSLENFADESIAVEVEEFFRKAAFSEASRSVQQATESIRCNAAWLARDAKGIEEFFSNFAF